MPHRLGPIKNVQVSEADARLKPSSYVERSNLHVLHLENARVDLTEDMP
jgi:hypothetical protein